MIHLRAFGVVLILLAALSIPIWRYWAYLTNGSSPPASTQILTQMESEGIPDFSLPDRNGKPIGLSDLPKDRILILNFWASWCAPCVREFPSLKRLAEKMPDQVFIIAISNDFEETDLDSFIAAMGDVPANFLILWDKDKKVAASYGTQALPESYITKPNRKLMRKVAGVDEWDSPNALEFFRMVMQQH